MNERSKIQGSVSGLESEYKTHNLESSGESLEIVEQKNGTVRVDLKEDSSLSTVQHGVWEKRLTNGRKSVQETYCIPAGYSY